MKEDTDKAPVRLIGAVEAAKRLRINRKTLYRYTLEGTITPAQTLPSGVFRYDPEHIEEKRNEWAELATA